jgi:hypothetical protein
LKKIAILAGLTLVLAGCFSPWQGDKGTVTVTIGSTDGNGRAVVKIGEKEYQEDDLTHTITFSGGPGPKQEQSVTGAGAVTFSVNPGRWTISVEAYHKDDEAKKELIAVGSKNVEIKPGPNKSVSITMGVPPDTYTVTFSSNGESYGVPQLVNAGDKVTRPANPIGEPDTSFNPPNEACLYSNTQSFLGWYIEDTKWDFDSPITGDITLTAKWSTSAIGVINDVPPNNVAAAFTYVKANAGTYTLLIDENVTVSNQLKFDFPNVNLTIRGIGNSTISSSTSGFFYLNDASTSLTLENITINGNNQAGQHMIFIFAGSLIMKEDSKLTNHINATGSSYSYSVVVVSGSNAKFTIQGGEISGNDNSYNQPTSSIVKVEDFGTFIMSGGIISDNNYTTGVDVYITSNSTFRLSGGAVIDALTLHATSSYSYPTLTINDSATINLEGSYTGKIGAINLNTTGDYSQEVKGLVLDAWANRKIITAGYDLSEGDIKNFGLGYSILRSSNNKNDWLEIRATHKLNSDGKLVKISDGSGDTLAGLQELLTNATDGESYTINVSLNQTISPQTLFYSGGNISITLRGTDEERTISLSSKGSMFTVMSGVTLILGNNITLQGLDNNDNPVVKVSGGTLVMNTGSCITGNITALNGCGGVAVQEGTFTMNGGKISGNTSGGGGGVSVQSGTFTMNGGEISGNTSISGGGGVYVQSGTFTMTNGEIKNNTATGDGGGVYVNSSSSFTMTSGGIKDNTATGSGGGVYMYSNSSCTMTGGEIKDNTATGSGGGVYVGGTFTMDGGEISGNEAGSGGGVYMYDGSYSIFYIVNGTIYGSNGAEESNTATTGAALYKGTYGTAQYGTFSDGWDDLPLTPGPSNAYYYTDNTIEVEDGKLQ